MFDCGGIRDLEILKRVFMKSAIFFLIVCGMVTSCSYINKKAGLEDDNPFEEGVEHVILREFGVDIDLSPESTE